MTSVSAMGTTVDDFVRNHVSEVGGTQPDLDRVVTAPSGLSPEQMMQAVGHPDVGRLGIPLLADFMAPDGSLYYDAIFGAFHGQSAIRKWLVPAMAEIEFIEFVPTAQSAWFDDGLGGSSLDEWQMVMNLDGQQIPLSRGVSVSVHSAFVPSTRTLKCRCSVAMSPFSVPRTMLLFLVPCGSWQAEQGILAARCPLWPPPEEGGLGIAFLKAEFSFTASWRRFLTRGEAGPGALPGSTMASTAGVMWKNTSVRPTPCPSRRATRSTPSPAASMAFSAASSTVCAGVSGAVAATGGG